MSYEYPASIHQEDEYPDIRYILDIGMGPLSKHP